MVKNVKCFQLFPNDRIILNVISFVVANKAFPTEQRVLDFIYNDMQETLDRPMENRSVYKLTRFLKGLKIDYKLKSNDPSGFTKRTYKVDNIGDPPCRHRLVMPYFSLSKLRNNHFEMYFIVRRFKPDKEGSREITVEQYFRDVKKIPLKYPHLPTIVTTNKNYLPIEVSIRLVPRLSTDVHPKTLLSRK